MPSYSYSCTKCQKIEHRTCSIAEMEEFEAGEKQHECGGELQRLYLPPRTQRFFAGWYPNLGPDPIYIDSMQQLHDVAEKTGHYSEYAEDMGGMFGRKRNRWV